MPPKRRGWDVEILDEHGVISKRLLHNPDVWVLPLGRKIVCNFVNAAPVGDDADGLLSQFIGTVARDPQYFPIAFHSWPKVPATRKEDIFKTVIKEKWSFGDNDQAAFIYIMKDIGRKWKDHRLKLWNDHYDITQPRDVNVRNPPPGISEDDWAMYIDYQLNPKTKGICETNAKNRALLTDPHTLGSKPIRRKRLELQSTGEEQISRGKMYIEARTKSDGSFVNEETRAKCAEIAQIEQNDPTSIRVSSNDSLARVLGKEHPGRVRSLGSGICPSVAFGQPSYRGSSSQRASTQQSFHEVSSSDIQWQRKVEGLENELVTVKSAFDAELQAVKSALETERASRQKWEQSVISAMSKCGVEIPANPANDEPSHSAQNEGQQHRSEDGGAGGPT